MWLKGQEKMTRVKGPQQAAFQLGTKYSTDSKIHTGSVHFRQLLSLQSCPYHEFDIKPYDKKLAFELLFIMIH